MASGNKEKEKRLLQNYEQLQNGVGLYIHRLVSLRGLLSPLLAEEVEEKARELYLLHNSFGPAWRQSYVNHIVKWALRDILSEVGLSAEGDPQSSQEEEILPEEFLSLKEEREIRLQEISTIHGPVAKKVVEMLAEGYTLREIAREVRMKRKALKNFIKENLLKC